MLVIIGLLPFNRVCGQAELRYQDISTDYLESYFHKTADIAASPVYWNTKEWAIFAGTIGSAGVAYAYDKDIREFFLSHQNSTTKQLTNYVFEPLGNPLYWAGAIGATYLIGEISDDANTRAFALTSGKALALNGLFTLAGKHLTHRARPFQGEKPDPDNWNGPFKNWRFDAFPSGHTSTAFTMATVFSEYYKEEKWVAPVAYTLAAFAGLSRIHDDKHWA
ncbi:MAG: phosphatase PAP2 family protein, partial [Bacteroidales bacterium]|nr:phosphatase PAP2 family protein [Bacteroidales bacterium]